MADIREFTKPQPQPVAGAAEWPLPPFPGQPPGAAGRLAAYIYHSAYLPVPEVAIAATLGLLAGVAGRQWRTWTDAQLNLYVVLVARSGIGKDHARDAVQTLMSAAAGNHDKLNAYVQWADMASGPALYKVCAENPCFVNMQGEWGHVLKGMASPRSHEGPMGALRRAITTLYSSKSKQGIAYSDSAKNVMSAGSVAFSMLAETTPHTFYSVLTPDMLADGFLSRFTVIEYPGDIPNKNLKRVGAPTAKLVELLKGLLEQAEQQKREGVTTLVQADALAQAELDAFHDYCIKGQRECGDNEPRRAPWARPHLKALKICCLLAVADNPLFPEVTLGHVKWALDLVHRDMKLFSAKHESGDIGDNDNVRQDKLHQFVKEYLLSKGAPKGYGVPDAMHAEGVVPRKYFQIRSSRYKLFTDAREGPIRSLDTALKSMCDSGYLLEIDKLKAADSFGFQGRCFRIVNHPGALE